MKTCPICGKKHNNKVYCSRKCHYDDLGRKPIVKCDYCGRKVKIKKTNKNKHHFCDRNCYVKHRGKIIKEQKDTLIERYNNGEMLKTFAKELGVSKSIMGYYRKKWGLKPRRAQNYSEVIKEVGRNKTEKCIRNFMTLYKQGKIGWRQAHKWASRIWKITEKPCEVCGWKEAERDMHLMIPRKLKKNNAVSLCPNHHRLAHRGKITLQREGNKLLIKKI